MTQETMLMTDSAANPTESGSVQATADAQASAPQQQGDQTQAQQPDQSSPDAVPEKYEFTPPEGKEYDPKVLEAFSAAAREEGMSQARAQKFLDRMATAQQERVQEQIQAKWNEWQEASKSDKEFGGDQLQQNLSVAQKALDKLATPELRTLLNETGLGNHPEVIRMFVRTGKLISEDSFVGDSRNGSQASAKDPAAILYPNMS